jgi:hypothetical protein
MKIAFLIFTVVTLTTAKKDTRHLNDTSVDSLQVLIDSVGKTFKSTKRYKQFADTTPPFSSVNYKVSYLRIIDESRNDTKDHIGSVVTRCLLILKFQEEKYKILGNKAGIARIRKERNSFLDFQTWLNNYKPPTGPKKPTEVSGIIMGGSSSTEVSVYQGEI